MGKGRGGAGRGEWKRPLKKSHDLAAVKWAGRGGRNNSNNNNNYNNSHIARTITKAMATKTYCKTETERTERTKRRERAENRELKTKN